MMLGKRARPPIKRTTSMTEFTLDLNAGGALAHAYQPSDPHNPFNGAVDQQQQQQQQQYLVAAKPQRRNSADFHQTANFLRVCCLCKRRLIPGRDIFMYRGDSAFCSLECRQQQMTQDERKEKKCCMMASKKEASGAGAGETVIS